MLARFVKNALSRTSTKINLTLSISAALTHNGGNEKSPSHILHIQLFSAARLRHHHGEIIDVCMLLCDERIVFSDSICILQPVSFRHPAFDVSERRRRRERVEKEGARSLTSYYWGVTAQTIERKEMRFGSGLQQIKILSAGIRAATMKRLHSSS